MYFCNPIIWVQNTRNEWKNILWYKTQRYWIHIMCLKASKCFPRLNQTFFYRLHQCEEHLFIWLNYKFKKIIIMKKYGPTTLYRIKFSIWVCGFWLQCFQVFLDYGNQCWTFTWESSCEALRNLHFHWLWKHTHCCF